MTQSRANKREQAGTKRHSPSSTAEQCYRARRVFEMTRTTHQQTKSTPTHTIDKKQARRHDEGACSCTDDG